MKIKYAGLCRQGLVRSNNEDNYYLHGVFSDMIHNDSSLIEGISEEKALFAVFDGMGGEADGEVASFLAASNIESLNLLEINRLICKYAKEKRLSFCGSTAAILIIKDGMAYVTNLGDSRIYCCRKGKMVQVSKDHVREWMGRRYITQSLGISDFMIEPYSEEYSISPGDKFLLCSDGLTDMLTDSEIETYLGVDPGKAVTTLMENVYKRGAIDNTTIIIVEVDE